MPKTLVIAEKPSVARDLAACLGRFDKREGFLENGQYIVSWAFGHLLELAEPEDYDPGLKRWDIGSLPVLPGRFKLNVTPSGKKQFGVLKNFLRSDAVDDVINACDAGREGELIFRRICEAAGATKPVRRLWLSEATPAAVKEAFRKLRQGRELDNLAAAAEARSRADWLVGINATRAFTCRHGQLLSVGRVQTPTLALVVQREREIRAFTPTPYWEIWAIFQKETGESYRGKWAKGDTDRILDQGEATALAARLSSQGEVARVEQKETREQPPTLFNLNDLQKEANKKHSLTAKATLDAVQALYERHKLLTYPRTDSRHLTEAIARDTLPGRVGALAGVPEYAGLIPAKLPVPGKRWVDDAKVTDHHAIIPTAAKPELQALGKNERLVYDLVVRRFLAIFHPEARYAVTKVTTAVSGENFLSKGRVELDPGWKVVYGRPKEGKGDRGEEGENEEQDLPALTKGEKVSVVGTEIPGKTTKPPPRYTEATLLAAMENAGRFVEDADLAGTLKGAGGIGTAATRAAIIETLITRSYIQREKKTLVPTPKGEGLIDLVPESLKSVELTARWENGLLDIERGGAPAAGWLEDIKNFTREVVQMAREQQSAGPGTGVPTQRVGQGRVVPERREAIGICPLCGRAVVDYPKSYGCSGYKDGCKFAVWKEIAGKKITVKQAQELLGKKKTGVLKGFKSKDGKSFDAALVLGQDGKVGFAFADKAAESLGRCPLCGREVIEGKKGWGCSGYKAGCKFVIWQEIAGKKVTTAQIKELLQKGRTRILKGFKSQAGKEFAAAMVLRPDGKVELEFAK
ncbi:MAG: DNA topoisomerase 3 [Peptococcaceae bacterium]|jgi:DNA topoisomerase-3|nr:DNA topoisomerase 3 [Peptococcaceae bacterium]